jgi:hypothetical protein
MTWCGAVMLKQTTVQSLARLTILGLSTTTQRGLTISGSLKVPLKSQTKMVPVAG